MNTLKSKTFTVTLSTDFPTLFAWLCNPAQLQRWHGAAWGGLSRFGPVEVRFVRDDRAGLLDLFWKRPAGLECQEALRVLPLGTGSEVVLTLLQPEGLSDNDFQLHVRWAEKAIQDLKHARLSAAPQAPVETVAPVSENGDAPSIDSGASAEATPELVLSVKRLYIGNLPFDWTDEQLREHFVPAGIVAMAEVARYGRSGRSRGFGFVEMATIEECQSAIEKFHGSLAGTRKIVVRASRPRENRPEPNDAPRTNFRSASFASPAVPQPEAALPAKAPAAEPAAAPKGIRHRLRELGSRLTRRQEREKQAGVIATGEYEFFPRGQKVEPSTEADDNAGHPRVVEASPYMEDTGDVENRGPRHPRRRPPMRRTRRTPPRR